MKRFIMLAMLLIAAPFVVVVIAVVVYSVAEYFWGDAWRHYWHVKEMGEVYNDRRRGLGKRK